MLFFCFLLYWLAVPAAAEAPILGKPQSHTEQVRARMQTGIAKQQQAVQRQLSRFATATPAIPETPAHVETPGMDPIAYTPEAVELTSVWHDSDCEPLSRKQMERLAGTVAEEAAVPVGVLLAMARQESAFQPCAVSRKGALGLMQLMPGTAQELGVADPFHPGENLLGGARYLRRLLDNYSGDLRLALAAYNAGPGTVREKGGVPNYPETRQYVDAILSRIESEE